MLQIQVLRVGQVNKPYIRVNIRELNGVLGAMYLSLYILTTDSLCPTSLAYSKWLCISYDVNMYCTHCMTSLFLNLLLYSLWLYNYVTITVTMPGDETVLW